MLTFDIYKTSSSCSFCVCFFFHVPFCFPQRSWKTTSHGILVDNIQKGICGQFGIRSLRTVEEAQQSIAQDPQNHRSPNRTDLAPNPFRRPKKRRPRAGGVLFFTGGFSCCWCKSLSQKTTKVGWTAFGSTVQEFEQIANSSLVFCTILYTIL